MASISFWWMYYVYYPTFSIFWVRKKRTEKNQLRKSNRLLLIKLERQFSMILLVAIGNPNNNGIAAKVILPRDITIARIFIYFSKDKKNSLDNSSNDESSYFLRDTVASKFSRFISVDGMKMKLSIKCWHPMYTKGRQTGGTRTENIAWTEIVSFHVVSTFCHKK